VVICEEGEGAVCWAIGVGDDTQAIMATRTNREGINQNLFLMAESSNNKVYDAT